MVENEEEIKNYYKWSSSLYNLLLNGAKHFGYYPRKADDISSREARRYYHKKVRETLDLDGSEDILDAGCGQGVVGVHIAKNTSCSVKGITIVDFEVDYARQLAHKYGVEQQAEFYYMNYSDMNFDDNAFDRVYTTESLVHSPNVQKTLNEFHRVLETGGKLVLFEYTLATDSKFLEREKEMLEAVIEGSSMRGLKQLRHDNITALLKSIGFTDVNVEEISERTAPSLRRLRKWFFIPYHFFIKPLGLQEYFPNITAVNEFVSQGEKDLIRYNIITAFK